MKERNINMAKVLRNILCLMKFPGEIFSFWKSPILKLKFLYSLYNIGCISKFLLYFKLFYKCLALIRDTFQFYLQKPALFSIICGRYVMVLVQEYSVSSLRNSNCSTFNILFNFFLSEFSFKYTKKKVSSLAHDFSIL